MRQDRRGTTLVAVTVVVVIIGFDCRRCCCRQFRTPARRPGGIRASAKMKQLAWRCRIVTTYTRRFPATSNQGNEEGVASVWWPLPGSGAATGAIPSAGYTTDAGTTQATAGYSWIVMILPYMDEMPLYDAISEASGEFAADAFTPYNVEGTARRARPRGGLFGGDDQRRDDDAGHFAAVQLDESPAPAIPAAGPSPLRPTQASRPATRRRPTAIRRAVKCSVRRRNGPRSRIMWRSAATHFPLMQYGTREPDVSAADDRRSRRCRCSRTE